MSDAAAPESSAAPVSAAIAGDSETSSALVEFAGADPSAAPSDAPQSEWAFAAHEAGPADAAIDSLREPQTQGWTPMVAIAAMMVAEADGFADDADALILTGAALRTADLLEEATAETPDAAMVMWSGAEAVIGDIGAGHVVVHAESEGALALHDVASHGISLDWTDFGPFALS